MELIFATHNAHKVQECNFELSQIPNLKVRSLTEVNILEELPETQATIEGNAIQKAQYVFSKFGYNCFADDSGLEIFALNGEPGVHSAYYGGAERSHKKNIELVLEKLQGKLDRTAQFKTVIALTLNDKLYIFEGICKGKILFEPAGTNGFGYDPIFQPEGFKQSNAQLTNAEKNAISSRGIATRKLIAFLKERFSI